MLLNIMENIQIWVNTRYVQSPLSSILAIVGNTESASNLNYVIIGLVVVIVVLLIITLGGNKK